MSETEPIDRPMFGHIVGIVVIDATNRIAYIAITGPPSAPPPVRCRWKNGDSDERSDFTKAARAGARAAVRKGPVGQPRRPATGFAQQGDPCRRGTARGRG